MGVDGAIPCGVGVEQPTNAMISTARPTPGAADRKRRAGASDGTRIEPPELQRLT
jgi:hypothetical protein